jgi:LysM repeat protein
MIKILVLLGFSYVSPTVPADSIGVETINGKGVVIHKVDAGETLYGLSKRYGTTVDDILKLNPTADGGLEIGQIVKVPYVRSVKQVSTNGSIHRVAEKETLFSISRLYGISVDDIKSWNKLASNSLSVGQELIIKNKNVQEINRSTVPAMASAAGVHTVEAKETLYSISKQYGVTIDQLKTWNNLTANELSLGQVLYVAQPKNSGKLATETTAVAATVVTPSKPSTEKTITISESVRGSDEMVSSGLAELIEGTEGNRKYLALHRKAPVGTILKIRNEMNNREVFVRVIGTIPDNAMNDKLLIKISKSAYDRLGAIDPRFRVEVTYYK